MKKTQFQNIGVMALLLLAVPLIRQKRFWIKQVFLDCMMHFGNGVIAQSHNLSG